MAILHKKFELNTSDFCGIDTYVCVCLKILSGTLCLDGTQLKVERYQLKIWPNFIVKMDEKKNLVTLSSLSSK